MRYKIIECDCGEVVKVADTSSCFICPTCGNKTCEPHVIGYQSEDMFVYPAATEAKPKATKPDLKSYGPKGIRGIRKD